MNEDWRLKRAAELFGGPYPAGSSEVLPLNFDRRSDENPGRRSGDRPEPRVPSPAGSSGPPRAAASADIGAAWPWRWRLLAGFLALQTALIVWLLVGRPLPVQRVIMVSPPVAAAAPPAYVPTEPTTLPLADSPTAIAPVGVVPPAGLAAKPTPATVPAATVPAATKPVAPRARPRPAPAAKRAPARSVTAARPAPVAAAPSTCIPGSGPVASGLCADPTLRRFDEQMQLAYAQVIAHGDKQLIALAVKDSARFVRRRDKCADTACLTRVYTDRIVALVKLLPAGAATPPICQPEQYTRVPLMNCWPWRLRDTRKPFYSK